MRRAMPPTLALLVAFWPSDWCQQLLLLAYECLGMPVNAPLDAIVNMMIERNPTLHAARLRKGSVQTEAK